VAEASTGKRRLPPPLPPGRRTVGQAVAETIRLYGARFVAALPIGLVVGTVNQVTIGRSRAVVTMIFLIAAPLFTLAFAYAARLTSPARVPFRAWLVALTVGTLVFVPAALTFPWFAIASVLWLSFVGLSVPAAMREGGSVTRALGRGIGLARAGYLHVAGTFLTLAAVFALTRWMLALVLESQADNTTRTAIFLSDVVISPLLFLGGALVYVDQDARLRSRAINAATKGARCRPT
jgi:hypothetical protein